MNSINTFIENIKNSYSSTEMPFINRQLQRVKQTKPYKGLTILHNIPFTKETIIKLGVLYEGGANLTVTSPSFMEADETLVKEFIAAGGRWKQLDDIKDETFDFHLDCAAELMNRIPPKIGTIEITATGSNKYGSLKVDYPIISVDKSKIKNLEGILGTGEAFVRAFEILTNEDLSNKNFMVFGYGKVGKGIAHYLNKKTKNVIVIDKIPENVEKAKLAGFEGYLSDEKAIIEKLAPKMFGIVTATGMKNVISDNYDSKAFKIKYLANMGGEDEFGYKFESNEVICQKKPINFFVDKPTLMRYIDPVFYAHNQGVDILIYSNLSNGLHSFPKFISEEIVNEWETIFNETVNI